MSNKIILDPCSGSRMFWFDKNHNEVIFGDNRELETALCDGRLLRVSPDMLMDVTNLPFDEGVFKLVVFDPPHLVYAGDKSWLAQKYGVLPKDWSMFLAEAFTECMRVLEPYGVLVCKWNTEQISFKEFIRAIGFTPLFGDRRGKTRWMVFMKLQSMN